LPTLVARHVLDDRERGVVQPDALLPAGARPRAAFLLLYLLRHRFLLRGLPAEQEPVRHLLAVLVRAPDEHVRRDAAEVVDHVRVDEARDPLVVALDGGPAGRRFGWHDAIVDRGRHGAVLMAHEVAGPGDPGHRLMIVAPELLLAARALRPAEAL